MYKYTDEFKALEKEVMRTAKIAKKEVANAIKIIRREMAKPLSTPAPVAVSGEDTKKRKKNIPKYIKTLVWNKYVGAEIAITKCLCCRETDIYICSFECGHVIAEAKGGDCTINNLRPICRNCNHAMRTRSMNDFTTEFFGWRV